MKLKFWTGAEMCRYHFLQVKALSCIRHTPVLAHAIFFLFFSLFLLCGGAYVHAANHTIKMVAEELNGSYLAYRMVLHEISDESGATDVTARYSETATMPGPTIVVTEGDVVNIELFHAIDPESPEQEHVSLHVHGVHYDIDSDGTLKYINLHKDESATPVMSYEYRWDAALGTAGTWAYHDHNFNSHNGAEDRGLYGALIVNPKSGVVQSQGDGQQNTISLRDIEKEYVLYMIDDAFVGMETDNANGQLQTPLLVNPSLTATKNAHVRFHLIALGTNIHQFEMPSYGWLDPGTNKVISQKAIGPLEKHVFTIRATHQANYMNTTLSGRLLGMTGNLKVTQ